MMKVYWVVLSGSSSDVFFGIIVLVKMWFLFLDINVPLIWTTDICLFHKACKHKTC